MYTAIRASANSVAAAVRAALEADPILGPRFDPGQGGLMRVSQLTPQEMADQNIDGLSVFVYQIVVDEQSRNRPAERVPPNGERPAPLPLRLRILFTPVVANLDPDFAPAVEHEIIGKVIETWHSQPFLRGAALVDELAGTDTQFAMRIEPLDIEAISRIWDVLEESYQLCVSYELGLVEIESALAELPTALVANVAAPVGIIAGVAP